jgi:hypothetical protein
MSKSSLGTALIVAGLVIAFVGFTADVIGIGRHPGMGVLQWGAVIFGLLALVAGFVMRSQGAAEGAGALESAPPEEPAAPPPAGEGGGGPEGPSPSGERHGGP